MQEETEFERGRKAGIEEAAKIAENYWAEWTGPQIASFIRAEVARKIERRYR